MLGAVWYCPKSRTDSGKPRSSDIGHRNCTDSCDDEHDNITPATTSLVTLTIVENIQAKIKTLNATNNQSSHFEPVIKELNNKFEKLEKINGDNSGLKKKGYLLNNRMEYFEQ